MLALNSFEEQGDQLTIIKLLTKLKCKIIIILTVNFLIAFEYEKLYEDQR